MPWRAGIGESTYTFPITEVDAELKVYPEAILVSRGVPVAGHKYPRPVDYPRIVRLYPGKKGAVLWLPRANVNPIIASLAELRLGMESLDGSAAPVASKVRLVWRVRLLFSRLGTTFDAANESEICSVVPPSSQAVRAVDLQLDGNRGQAKLPPETLKTPGIQQVRLVALDALGIPVGLPSEPISVLVRGN